jgi:hypothetical protein
MASDFLDLGSEHKTALYSALVLFAKRSRMLKSLWSKGLTPGSAFT